MTAPKRAKSQLAGVNFLDPSPREQPQPPTESVPEATPKAVAPGVKRPSTKVAYYADADQNGRIRAAFIAGRDRYGWRSFTDFQLTTMLQRVEQLEAELNGGERFVGVPPKAGPLGRPFE